MLSLARNTSTANNSILKPANCALGKSTLAFLFVLVLALTISHHLNPHQVKVVLIYDAMHYLETCRQITSCLLKLLHGQFSAQIWSSTDLSAPLLIDGPVFPTLYALFFAAIGRLPEHTDWRILVIGQSILHALSACLVAKLSFTLTNKKVLAVLTGLLWGVYPAAVLGSGQFLTESLTVFLLLSYLSALSCLESNRNQQAATLSGLLMGLLILLKPALIPATLVCAAVGLYRSGKSKRLVSIVFMAAALTILPWMLYTKAVTGKAYLTTQRLPAGNLAVGCDTETAGYGVMPVPPLTNLLTDNDVPIAPVLGQWMHNGANCLRITAAKLSVILGMPWNDFRHRVWGLNPLEQTWLHISMLFLSIWGAVCWLSKLGKPASPQGQNMVILCLTMAGGQLLVYLAFTTVSRYGLTIMPALLLLAPLAIWSAIRNALSHPWRVISSALLSAGLCLTIVNASSILVPATAIETQHPLTAGSQAIKFIDLSSTHYPTSGSWSLLLIDGDSGLSNVVVSINGHRLPGHPRLIYHYFLAEYPILPIVRQQAAAMGIPVTALRQWRAIAVPSSYINSKGLNQITLQQEQGQSIVYGDLADSCRYSPSFKYFSFHKMFASPTSLDARLMNPITTAAVKQKSLLSSAPELASSLRIRLLPLPHSGPESAQVAIYKKNLDASNFDPLLKDPQQGADGVRINKNALKYAASTECRVELPKLPAASHLLVKLKGQIRCLKGPGHIGIALVLIGQNNDYHVLDLPPVSVAASTNWRGFELEDLVPAKLLQGAAKIFAFNLYPCPWTDAHYGSDANYSDAQLRKLEMEISTVNAPEITGDQFLLY